MDQASAKIDTGFGVDDYRIEPEFGDDIRYGVKRGYETSQKGTGRDVYQSIVGLRDFVFQLIRSADFREAIGEFFQYLQILAGEVNIDEKGSGKIISKLASGIKSMGVSDESKTTEPVHETTSEVVSSVGGGSLNLQHKQEESLLPSKVHSEEELKKNQGKLSEPGEFSKCASGPNPVHTCNLPNQSSRLTLVD